MEGPQTTSEAESEWRQGMRSFVKLCETNVPKKLCLEDGESPSLKLPE